MSDTKDLRLLVEIAHMYYDEGAKQSDVAKKFNISRSLVSRYLSRAREAGIVEITIHDEFLHPHRNLEKKVKAKFDLRDVICVSSQPDKQVQKKRVAAAAAQYLVRQLERNTVVSISAGTTLHAMASSISSAAKMPGVTFVPMTGGLGNQHTDIQANVLCELFAAKLEAQRLELHAPVMVDSIDARDILMKQSFISDVMTKAKLADIAIVGIGGRPTYSNMSKAYLHKVDPKVEINQPEIIGDICYNFINNIGEPVDCEWNRRVIALDLKSIKKIPLVIAVAEGEEKLNSIYASIKGSLINALVIDSTTAAELLEKP